MPRIVPIYVTKDDFHERYLQVMNGISQLTPRQLEVMVELVKWGVITTRVRQTIRKQLGFPSEAAFNLIIADLKKKGAIYRNAEGTLKINPYLVPETDQTTLTFEFIWKDIIDPLQDS